MASVGDVVTLFDASVGVVSEQVSAPRYAALWRVLFPDSSGLVVSVTDITETLDPPTYQPGDVVQVWPHIGPVQSMGAGYVVVRLDRSERVEGVGVLAWQPEVPVPFWRVVLDNDARLKRMW